MTKRDGRRSRSRRSTSRPRRGHLRVVSSAAVLVLGVGFLAYASKSGGSGHHPTPRPGVTAAKVMPASRYASVPRLANVYREVSEVPGATDGVYCYCHCIENMGHRSLLSCFESDHAAGCGVCLSEGDMVYRMTQQGRSLDEIRQAIDDTFSS